jgi:uncharacterized protein (TIGR00251 family)
MSDRSSPISISEGGIRLAVRVTPRAKKSGVTGTTIMADGRPALSIRLAAPPVDGSANKALIAFLAKQFGVPRSAVRIVSGETSRLKMVEVTGVTAEQVSRRLETRPD